MLNVLTVRKMKKAKMSNVFKRVNLVLAVLGLVAFLLTPLASANAATLSTASLGLSDSRPSQTGATYTFTTSNVTTSAIKCIRMIFATTATGSTVPTGMSTTSAALSGTSNYIPTPGGWTVTANVNGTVDLTNASGETPASASARTVILTGITNSSVVDTSYYLRFNTYNNTDCTSSGVDSTTVTFINTDGTAVSLGVDPTLSFTVAGTASATSCNGATSNVTTTATTVPFGTVTTSANKIGVQNLTVTTNAGNGYTVYTRYTAKPTFGSNTISDHSGSNATPTAFSAAGTEAYGYTTNDSSLGTGTTTRFTSTPNVWAAFTTSNSEVAYSNAAASSQTTCVGQQVGIGGTTPAGSYTTSVIYTATPVY